MYKVNVTKIKPLIIEIQRANFNSLGFHEYITKSKSNIMTCKIVRVRKIFICLFVLLISLKSLSQGRVVINEFMPWTSNGCGGPTAEFVELLNFGPGPVNIGCYILTDGDYAITIPPNTIIQPGEFYVIAGQSVIDAPCANIDSTITADLNWNTCGCTSAPIPTTGDGFLTDGGSASEQVVLLDPNLVVVDAVIRNLPAEPSSLITTSSVAAQCTSRTFDLDLMAINYETIGQSAGRGNSFARKLDGDCGWVKDPQQSANATNNTPSDVSDVKYSFAVTQGSACGLGGSVGVVVTAPNFADVFPMNYTLAYDTDNDNVFEVSDSYTNGTAVTPNIINVGGLIPGQYRITLASVLGCNLKTFPFNIVTCGGVLPVNIASFAVSKTGTTVTYRWSIANPQNLDRVVIEKSSDASQFSVAGNVIPPINVAAPWNDYFNYDEQDGSIIYFRIHLIDKYGAEIYSPVITIANPGMGQNKVWPNPAIDQVNVQLYFEKDGLIRYSIINASNQVVQQMERSVSKGTNLFSFVASSLPAGTYQLRVELKGSNGKPVMLRFMKL